MTHSTIAIVGAGITGIMLAYELTSRGYDVTIFEKGQHVPTATTNFTRLSNRLSPSRPQVSRAMREIEQVGDKFGADLVDDLRIQVGGMAHDWEAITLRMQPNDFRVGSRYGRGIDWALSYDDLEPYYGQAEAYVGVSGTDDDNPFAPPRSTPYPLPPFELGYYDVQLQEQLANADITIHTTPQARTREAYNGRAGCQNFGVCNYCPVGARYTPTYHLNLAMQTGLLTLESNTSVRKVITDGNRASALLVQNNDAQEPREHSADVIILSPGAIHAARLLLLSTNNQYPDGLANNSGHVGKHIYFHMLRLGIVRLPDAYTRGRTGFWTAQSQQFVDHDERNEYGGIKIELMRRSFGILPASTDNNITGHSDNPEVAMQNVDDTYIYPGVNLPVVIHAESDMNEEKYLTLSNTLDPLGDPIPKVHYPFSEFDDSTYIFGQNLVQRYADALGGTVYSFPDRTSWITGNHHMGGTRMSETEADGVTDSNGKVHGIENLFITGAGNFPNTMAVNPTLTLTALAFRTLDYLLDQQLEPI